MGSPTFAILVMIDIVNSTQYIEKVGDREASKTFRLYDKIFRGLLIKYNGIEIDKTDGALLLFETMKDAVNYVIEYHKLVETHLKLYSRVGIHCGTIMMHSNSQVWVSRGAKPIEVEGLEKVLCARIMSLAGAGETIATKRASQIILSLRSVYVAHIGEWKLKGVKEPIPLFSVSNNKKRLKIPKSTEKVKLVKRPKLTPKERARRLFNVFVLPFICLYGIEFYICVLELYRFTGKTEINLYPVLKLINKIQDSIVSLFYLETWINFLKWILK